MTSGEDLICHAPHAQDARDVLAAARVDPERGLTATEAADRLTRWGRNDIRGTPTVPMWRRALAQFQNPLVYLLGVAIVVSSAAWWVEGRDGLPVDAIVITAVLLANAVIGLAQQAKADDAVAALARMTEADSTVIRDGLLIAVPSSQLVPGDLLALCEGDAVGADARLISATRLTVHQASLTGESAPVVKDPATLPPDTPLADRANMVHKGTAVVEGVGRAVVTGTGMATEVGSIADLLDSTAAAPSPLERELAQVTKTVGLLVVGIAVLVMGSMWAVTGADTPDRIVTILLTGVSLAVAAVPEGLVAILSLVLAVGVRAMAARGALVKDPHSVETLGSTSVICSDKTGTLTRNEMTLRRIVTASGSVDLSGSGYVPQGEALFTPATPDAQGYAAALAEARAVLIGGVVANNAQLSQQGQDWAIHGDPTEAAFLVAQHKLGDVAVRCAAYQRRGEIPFTSARKLMSVVAHHPGRGEHRIYTKGAPDVLLTRCTSVRVGNDVVGLDAPGRAAILADIEALSAEGFRTLGVGYRAIPDSPTGTPSRSAGDGPAGGSPAGRLDVEAPPESAESELTFVGVVGIIDPPRDQVPAAVAEARRAGIRPIMITGDHPVTARRIAADLGMTTVERPALSGIDIDRLDDTGLAAAVRTTDVFARVSPAHKLRIIDALQADQHTVAMTGDGVNDAPALKSADIGIAMGITGTEVTKEAATMILGDDNFATIIAAVRAGRVIYANLAKFLRYLLSSNLGEVVTVFVGVLFGAALGLTDAAGATLVPLLATQILWINLVTDAAPALALGVDPEIGDVMLRPPRPRDARILDGPAWWRIGWVGVVMGVVTLLTLDLLLPGGLIVDGNATIEVARTAGFTTLVLAQLLNAFAVRSSTVSAWRGVGSNRWLLAACGFGVLAQVAVVHVPALQEAFATAPLTAGQWILCAVMASVVLLSQELVKAVARAPRLPEAGLNRRLSERWGRETRP